jgi:GMP synthase-like glutamine amidotransferase
VRVLSIVHQRDAGSGTFAEAAEQRGDELVEWVPARGPAPDPGGFGAVLVFGGGMHVDHEAGHPWLRGEKELLRRFLAAGTPVLGVCLGAQLVAEAGGGAAGRLAAGPEIGWKAVELLPGAERDPLTAALPIRFDSFQWHSYEVLPPPGAVPLARSAACLQAFRLDSAPAWGIQFHAEVTAETVASWARDYAQDEDARAVHLDPRALVDESAGRIGRWTELGRGLCRRFLERAAAGAG